MGGWLFRAGSQLRFPPSIRIPVVQGSKLNPPLGSVRNEVRHLNLLWSIARLDALALALRTSRLSVDELAANFRALPQEIERLAREMNIVIRVRHNNA